VNRRYQKCCPIRDFCGDGCLIALKHFGERSARGGTLPSDRPKNDSAPFKLRWPDGKRRRISRRIPAARRHRCR
jgi:hypothetical protein